MDRDGGCVQFRCQSGFFAQMEKVGREPVAEVDGRIRLSSRCKLQPDLDARFGIQMRVLLFGRCQRRKAFWVASQGQQVRSRTAQLTGHVDYVSRARAGTQKRMAALYATDQSDIGYHQCRVPTAALVELG